MTDSVIVPGKQPVSRNLILTMSIVLVFAYIAFISFLFLRVLHVDECWYLSIAGAKYHTGIYIDLPYRDIPAFQNGIYLLRDLTTQFHRLFLLIFNDGVLAVRMLRLFYFGAYLMALGFYAKEKGLLDRKFSYLIYGSVGLLLPLQETLSITRPETPLTILAVLILMLLLDSSKNDSKVISILLLCNMAIWFHFNGVLFFIAGGMAFLFRRNLREFLIFVNGALLSGIIYYLISIDPNIDQWTSQFREMFTSGSVQKTFSLNHPFSLLLMELNDRYNPFLYKRIAMIISRGLTLVSLVFFFWKSDESWRAAKIFIGTFLFSLLFINKNPGYLNIILPIPALFTMHNIHTNKRFCALLILVLLLGTLMYDVWQIYRIKTSKLDVEISTIEKNLPDGSTIYSFYSFYPYFRKHNNFMTITHKYETGAFLRHYIPLKDTYWVTTNKVDLRQLSPDQFAIILRTDNYLVFKWLEQPTPESIQHVMITGMGK